METNKNKGDFRETKENIPIYAIGATSDRVFNPFVYSDLYPVRHIPCTVKALDRFYEETPLTYYVNRNFPRTIIRCYSTLEGAVGHVATNHALFIVFKGYIPKGTYCAERNGVYYCRKLKINDIITDDELIDTCESLGYNKHFVVCKSFPRKFLIDVLKKPRKQKQKKMSNKKIDEEDIPIYVIATYNERTYEFEVNQKYCLQKLPYHLETASEYVCFSTLDEAVIKVAINNARNVIIKGYKPKSEPYSAYGARIYTKSAILEDIVTDNELIDSCERLGYHKYFVISSTFPRNFVIDVLNGKKWLH